MPLRPTAEANSSVTFVSTTPAITTTMTDGFHSNDVLLGRGGCTNSHVGNRKFRAIVAKHQEEYLKARKKDKALIAKHIVEIVHSYGGRFLKRDDGSTAWVEVSEKRATEKTSQALREGLDVRNHTIRPSKMPRRDSESISSMPRKKLTITTTMRDFGAPSSPALVSLAGEVPDYYEEHTITYQAPQISADDCDNVVEV